MYAWEGYCEWISVVRTKQVHPRSEKERSSRCSTTTSLLPTKKQRATQRKKAGINFNNISTFNDMTHATLCLLQFFYFNDSFHSWIRLHEPCTRTVAMMILTGGTHESHAFCVMATIVAFSSRILCHGYNCCLLEVRWQHDVFMLVNYVYHINNNAFVVPPLMFVSRGLWIFVRIVEAVQLRYLVARTCLSPLD